MWKRGAAVGMISPACCSCKDSIISMLPSTSWLCPHTRLCRWPCRRGRRQGAAPAAAAACAPAAGAGSDPGQGAAVAGKRWQQRVPAGEGVRASFWLCCRHCISGDPALCAQALPTLAGLFFNAHGALAACRPAGGMSSACSTQRSCAWSWRQQPGRWRACSSRRSWQAQRQQGRWAQHWRLPSAAPRAGGRPPPAGKTADLTFGLACMHIWPHTCGKPSAHAAHEALHLVDRQMVARKCSTWER